MIPNKAPINPKVDNSTINNCFKSALVAPIDFSNPNSFLRSLSEVINTFYNEIIEIKNARITMKINIINKVVVSCK